MKKMISVIFLLVLSGASFNAFSGQGNVEVCHKGNEIVIASPAVPAHKAHGDTVGSCEGLVEPVGLHVVMMRCDAIAGNGVEVLSYSSSFEDDDSIDQLPVDELNCPEVMARLLNNGFRLRSIKSGTAEAEIGDGDVVNPLDAERSLQLYVDYLLFKGMRKN